MRFRYMRFWVESGHQKAGLRVSPMLRMAMDFLDKELNRFSCLKVRLSHLWRKLIHVIMMYVWIDTADSLIEARTFGL